MVGDRRGKLGIEASLLMIFLVFGFQKLVRERSSLTGFKVGGCMKIAIVTSEAVPYAKTGGLADVCGALPLELENLSEGVILVMPKYACVRRSGVVFKKIDEDFDVVEISDNTKAYFLKHDMFLREDLYGDRLGDFGDNLKRFSYFCQKVLSLFKKIDFIPDVIHCHDWQTSLIPVFIKAYGHEYFFGAGKKPKTLLTIHNISYQGIFPKEQMLQTGLGWEYFTLSSLEYYDQVNLLKGGIIYADIVNTVSATHAQEIQTKEFGCGLEGVLATRKNRFFGVINGVDYKIWNPQGDSRLFHRYSLANFYEKKINKLKLQDACGLAKSEDRMLLGFVGRWVRQKGIDLLARLLPNLSQNDIQAVILGVGEPDIEADLRAIARDYPKMVFVTSDFDDDLAHKIYAGCDVFAMPSRFEPCGTGQLISFKYGTVPIVYKTGGLADTVQDYNFKDNTGTGFVFSRFDEPEFLCAINRAKELFGDKKAWRELGKSLMRLNFSWKESAKKYTELYQKA